MARQKGRSRGGGGGFRPELRGTLGTLLRTTLQQAGAVRDAARDVLERGAREGRSRLDEARTNRKRQDALAELGEIVLQLIRDGEIDIAELPEAAEIVRHLDDLDDSREDRGDERERDEDTIAPPMRRRFDDRSDGTVSSERWTPPRAATPARVWRPPGIDPEREPRDRERDDTPTVPPPTRGAKKKGGIRFDDPVDDDADLKDYMHPDDVPPKPSKE